MYIEPRFFGISLTDAFHLPKQCLAQICALALVLLFAYELTSQGTITLAWGHSMYGLALFIIWSSLSLAYTPAIANGLREIMRWVTYGVILFSSMNERSDATRRRSIIIAACASAALVSLVALAQFFGLDFSEFRSGYLKTYSTSIKVVIARTPSRARRTWQSQLPANQEIASLRSQ